MFHGPIRELVDKEPTGGLVRSNLYYFIMDFLSGKCRLYAVHDFCCYWQCSNLSRWLSAYEKRSPLEFCCCGNAEVAASNDSHFICALGALWSWHFHTLHFLFGADFFVGRKLQFPNFRDSLKERGMVQMLTVGREAAIEVQVSFCTMFCQLISGTISMFYLSNEATKEVPTSHFLQIFALQIILRHPTIFLFADISSLVLLNVMLYGLQLIDKKFSATVEASMLCSTHLLWV